MFLQFYSISNVGLTSRKVSYRLKTGGVGVGGAFFVLWLNTTLSKLGRTGAALKRELLGPGVILVSMPPALQSSR